MRAQLIKRGKINWLLRDSSVVAFDNFQATIYHSYGMPTRTALVELKTKIRESKEDELSTWVDVIELTQSLGIKGYGTELRTRWFEHP